MSNYKKLYVMKFLKFLCLILTSQLILNCSHEGEPEITSEELNSPNTPLLQRSTTQATGLIVYYPEGTTEAEKQIIRQEHDVETYKKCECADPRLERWGFSEGVDLNQKKIAVGTGDGDDDEDLNGDFDFITKLENMGASFSVDGGLQDALSMQVSTNDGPTIAVIDSGIAATYVSFTQPFLYNNSSENPNCKEEDYFGWDFVDNDNNPHDEYGHGTLVSEIIHTNLVSAGIDHQIMPIRAFDADGQGDMFNILCALRYAQQKEDVAIINMSLGTYHWHELLKMFLKGDEFPSKLVVTSAGNDSIDTDIEPHYPSSYAFDAILSVASSAIETPINQISLSNFSNYGSQSVDIAAPGEQYLFYGSNIHTYVEGTSFSAAFASYCAARVYSHGQLPSITKQMVINETIYNQNLNMIKHSSTLMP